MLKTIYLDMDGVLCDFKSAVVDKNLYNPKENTINWEMLKGMGSEFWTNLQWLREGQRLYAWLFEFCMNNKIDLCILSSVGFTEGALGKKAWLSAHTKINPMCIYIVRDNKAKLNYAAEDALLIDDFGKNVKAFMAAGGNAIQFKNNAKDVVDKIKLLTIED